MIRFCLLSASALLCLCGAAFSQTSGSYTTFGSGCPGSNKQTPVLGHVSVPVIGKQFSVTLTGAKASTGAGLITGSSNTMWSILPLPLPLGAIGADKCYLNVSFETMLPIAVDAAGKASIVANLPNDKSLVGVQFYQQIMIVDLGANSLGLVFTNGGAGKIGG